MAILVMGSTIVMCEICQMYANFVMPSCLSDLSLRHMLSQMCMNTVVARGALNLE
jgi:hypothetical protein